MSEFTVGQRLILHLGRFEHRLEKIEYVAPFEISQDGCGVALTISRAHASLELKKLRDKGFVREAMAHIVDSPVRRKVYFLTEEGYNVNCLLVKDMEAKGLSYDVLFHERLHPSVNTNANVEKAYQSVHDACIELAFLKDKYKPDTTHVMIMLMDAIKTLALWNAGYAQLNGYGKHFAVNRKKPRSEDES